MNGMAAHGGILPFGATFLVFSDYMKASIRLSALSQLKSLWVFTHDSIGVGEDGPRTSLSSNWLDYVPFPASP